ncbi:MAG: TlpA family protein disulfide reductase [Hyphomicrobiales bacterium]|nr:TlpA family protein disulfide reductase [Hyphomicrobiales bacterium]MBV9115151.1 TlpA family protein disulfide reductase [Hyphomicrobiales bacterium]MBV9517855.1 TlpA family protein disulfide reductase [Hyphomicrobiales bacterium]
MRTNSARRLVILALAGIGLSAAGGFYATRGASGNSACVAARQTVERLKPLAIGEVAALQVVDDPAPAPNLVFFADDGAPKKLADFKGKAVLVNIWATWCIPCRQEMPALDKLEGDLGSPKFEVVPINIDQRNPDKPRAFLQEIGVKHLDYFYDQSVNVFQDLKASTKVEGLPVSVLVGADGCALGVINGPADWASADAAALVKAALPR